MEKISLICIALCVAHLICFIVRLVIISKFYDRRGFPMYDNNVQEIVDISSTVLLILLSFGSWAIMLYYKSKGLDITPIKGMCIYMILPGVAMLIFNAVSEKVELVATLFLLLNTSVAVVMLAPAA